MEDSPASGSDTPAWDASPGSVRPPETTPWAQHDTQQDTQQDTQHDMTYDTTKEW